MNRVSESFVELMDIIRKTVSPEERNTLSLETCVNRSTDPNAHRIWNRHWQCSSCNGTGRLNDIVLVIGTGEVECPHCEAIDAIEMMDDVEC